MLGNGGGGGNGTPEGVATSNAWVGRAGPRKLGREGANSHCQQAAFQPKTWTTALQGRRAGIATGTAARAMRGSVITNARIAQVSPWPAYSLSLRLHRLGSQAKTASSGACK